MEKLDELKEFLNEVLGSQKRLNLMARAAAWSSMRVRGQVPEDAPPAIARHIETDLAEHGFSLLRASLTYKELGGDQSLIRKGFETAGQVFEALTTNSAEDLIEAGFYRIISACCYHIAGFSAMAYSIINNSEIVNLTPVERGLTFLILRNISELKIFLKEYLGEVNRTDEALSDALEIGEIDEDELVAEILNISGCKALAYFEFALQTGNQELLETSKWLLTKAVKLAVDASNVPNYWVLRLISLLVDDLWISSLHQNLPVVPPTDEENNYDELRELFLATLYSRSNAEIELWPSQLEAAKRSADLLDDLVVALPTSAGKTRIAELTALMTLCTGKRVLIVTPLRALSAQTERSFRSTFGPLGFKVSSLYGASGSSGDDDALRTNDIIISTPEKLDFALRSDPTIIDDVSLVILDEGHLIGASEREIRFEILVQKLLKRNDAALRRIVCLSAILPGGQQLTDLTLWIRNDKEGSPITVPWRPTRQRFGTITVHDKGAKLNFGKEDSDGFIGRFIEYESLEDPIKLRSSDVRDVTMTSAWKFAREGKRVLVFVTQANWVEGFGRVALDLVSKGFLPSLGPNQVDISRAVKIGEEWLGVKHPAVLALKIGIGIHHGKLPSPFLRELELLLANGKILITVASPTLSQGLNINAAVLLVPYLIRNGAVITGEEFANVAGRAGRAFVDVEGLILHIVHNDLATRKRNWFNLVQSARSRNLESGILQVINSILVRLSTEGVLKSEDAFEYLANNINAWRGLSRQQIEAGKEPEPSYQIEHDLEMLDAMVLGLIEDLDVEEASLSELLDKALTSSLWERQLVSHSAELIEKHRKILNARAGLIWRYTDAQTRRGHFAMGVGLEAGLKIDKVAEQLSASLAAANSAASIADLDALFHHISELAEVILSISPFAPDGGLPANWKEILHLWLSGASIDMIGPNNMKFIEDVFIYKLVWAMESIRVRILSTGIKADFEVGIAAACVETGTSDYQIAFLIRAGLPSRIAATAVVRTTGNALFTTSAELREWLRTEQIEQLTQSGEWPTSDTSEIWQKFRSDFLRQEQRPLRKYQFSSQRLPVRARRPKDGLYRLVPNTDGICEIQSPDFVSQGRLSNRLVGEPGQIFVKFDENVSVHPIVYRIGPGRVSWRE